MNRRKLFTFLAVSPVVGVAEVAEAMKPPVKRIDFETHEIVEEGDILKIQAKDPERAGFVFHFGPSYRPRPSRWVVGI